MVRSINSWYGCHLAAPRARIRQCYSRRGIWGVIHPFLSWVSAILQNLLNAFLGELETLPQVAYTVTCLDSDAPRILKLLEAGRTSEVESSLRPVLDPLLPVDVPSSGSSMILLNLAKKPIASVYVKSTGTGTLMIS